ncbi:MAG: hypothetical protein AAGF23_07370 [Acidobacteriota bacterium]
MKNLFHDDDLCLMLDEQCGGDGAPCDECLAYAALFDGPSPEQALPAGLRSRLRGIADDFAEADPLYARALAGETLGDEIPAGEAENPGRRAAHDALAVTFAEARRPRPLPEALRARLRAVPRRYAAQSVPVWLADSRWATAASLVLTAALALLAGDASARFQQTAAAFKEPAPLVLELGAGEWASKPAELGELIVDARRVTGARLGDAGDVASHEAKGVVDTIQTWRRAAAERWLGTAKTTWRHAYDGAAERLDAAAETLEETKIGQALADLMQQGENDE